MWQFFYSSLCTSKRFWNRFNELTSVRLNAIRKKTNEWQVIIVVRWNGDFLSGDWLHFPKHTLILAYTLGNWILTMLISLRLFFLLWFFVLPIQMYLLLRFVILNKIVWIGAGLSGCEAPSEKRWKQFYIFSGAIARWGYG